MAKKPPIIVTSGPTREFIDPIRYISNPSSGKMGYFIAKAALLKGYPVTYIAGPGDPEYRNLEQAKNIPVTSTEDMLRAVKKSLQKNAILIMAAAPADYRPEKKSPVKLKKTEAPELRLVPNPDILKEVSAICQKKNLPITLVGFAAETHNGEKYALKKLQEKNLDLIFLNDLSRKDSGFGVDTNQLTVFRRDGLKQKWKTATKEELGFRILEQIEIYLQKRQKDDFSRTKNR